MMGVAEILSISCACALGRLISTKYVLLTQIKCCMFGTSQGTGMLLWYFEKSNCNFSLFFEQVHPDKQQGRS